jgi:hypothetical protein
MDNHQIEEMVTRMNRQVLTVIEHQIAIVALLARIETRIDRLTRQPERPRRVE